MGMRDNERLAREMEREIFRENPDLADEGPYIEFYLNYLNHHPTTVDWPTKKKIARAIKWTRQDRPHGRIK